MIKKTESSHNDQKIMSGAVFRHIYIVESRDGWSAVAANYDASQDLVLTYDFGLRRDIEALGGIVRFVDHLCSQEVMQENNFLIYEFFREWHFDSEGKDIFRHRDVDFGFSFRIDIWNDYTFYVRSRLCLAQLKNISYQKLFVTGNQERIEMVLRDLEIIYDLLVNGEMVMHGKYFFPIHQWMDERLHSRRFRHVIRNLFTRAQGILMGLYDNICDHFFQKKQIFIQEYHPTRKLLQELQKHPGIQVIQAHFSQRSGIGRLFRDRPIPIFGDINKKQMEASKLLDAFRNRRNARLILSTGDDVTDSIYKTIEMRIAGLVAERLRNLDCVIHYLDHHPTQLNIFIGNLGQIAMLIDSASKCKNIPSYMIINGLMTHPYEDDAKYATVINSYSHSMRDNYFREMNNIVCLGDPRMDDYALASARKINRKTPTITIGASGFSNIDLNSYLAIEFVFLYEVLTAITNITSHGYKFQVILKVRANGYASIYRQFIDEYFPGFVDQIVDQVPIRSVLDITDFYVTLSSQTLFEASCLGIPCVYHKNDCEILDPPFDEQSELVTTSGIDALEEAISDFLEGSKRFDSFLEKSVMEKYIGPLDGKNLERNLTFVHGLLKHGYKGQVS